MNKLAIVILNWNGRDFLIQYLPSVIKYSSISGVDIIVADNASTDDSLQVLENNFPNVKIIKLDKNYGFAEGYNRALKTINYQYFILLNSDVAVTENWLQPMIKIMDESPTIAASMPTIRAIHNPTEFEYAGAAGGYIDKYGYPFCRGRIFDFVETDHGQYNNTQQIFWATGACLMIRSDIYNKLGGLDDDFFAHMEEIDLCWRINNSGYSIVHVANSVVYHVGGGALPKENPQKTYLNFRNNLYLLLKNLPKNKLFSILLIRMFLDGISFLKFIFSGKFRFGFAIFNAHISFYTNYLKMYKKRYYFNNYSNSNIYNRSIVYDFFIKKRNTFDKLTF